jgi:hypothetical protein
MIEFDFREPPRAPVDGVLELCPRRGSVHIELGFGGWPEEVLDVSEAIANVDPEVLRACLRMDQSHDISGFIPDVSSKSCVGVAFSNRL